MINIEPLAEDLQLKVEQMADSVRGIKVKAICDPVFAPLDSAAAVIDEHENWYGKGLTKYERLAQDLDLPLNLAKWYALNY